MNLYYEVKVSHRGKQEKRELQISNSIYMVCRFVLILWHSVHMDVLCMDLLFVEKHNDNKFPSSHKIDQPIVDQNWINAPSHL